MYRASPWQLYEPLAQFTETFNFPAGTFHMRFFRWKEGQTLRRDRHGNKKLAVIDAIMQSLPRRSFLLVGDSGEYDPEIYGELFRRYPEQVRGIYIRNVRGEPPRAQRFYDAFTGMPPERWKVFDDPAEIPQELP